MSALRRIPPIRLTVVMLVLAALVLLTGLKLARAQEGGAPAWTDADIGLAPTAGSAQSSGPGACELTSAGTNINGTADAFNFLYQPLGTNGQIVAQVGGLQGANGCGKTGLMIRETLDADCRNGALLLTASGGLCFQWRPAPGGASRQTPVMSNMPASSWIKLVRSGDWIGGYSSTDGANWTLVGWADLGGLAPVVYVGMVVTGDNPQGLTAAAAFNQVTVEAADPTAVLNPVIGTGDGLEGSYFDNRDLYGTPLTNRVDAQVDFDFGALTYGRAASVAEYARRCQAVLGMPKSDEFSARWVGELQAQFSEPYTLYVKSDDGARVWLNEQLIIDDWKCHPSREASATVNLVAGQKYLLRVEYFQAHGGSSVELSWSSPLTPKELVPQSQLYSQPVMDPDGSGLPVQWELRYFGQTGVDPNADADGDGLSNLQKWQRHRDPTNPFSRGVMNPWGHGDVDHLGGSKGDASYSNGVFTVRSSGMDIFKKQDSFHYVYRFLGTNGELVAHVSGIEGTNGYPKVGVMIRETLDDNARNVMMLVRGRHGVSFQWRAGAGWGTAQTVRTNLTAIRWLKVARNGDWLGGYYSADGTNWTLLNWQTMKGLAPRIYAGLAVAPRNQDYPGGTVRAQFDHVNLGAAPAAEVLSPVEGTGDGLLGSYCNGSLLYLPGQTNWVDPQVNFAWVHEPPAGGLNPDSYGVCWSGEVEAQFSEPYTFSVATRREDWVRVWVNERLVINEWRVWHPDGEFYGTPVNLVAGRHYLIRVEMFNHDGKGKAVLNWSSPSTSKRLILQSQLYSQPQMDPDGSGLPVIWEQIYFGHTGVDANADPDGDGLSNLQEYKYHTNPLKADTDHDGIPDAWEIAHGLDPQFADASLDYDLSGLSNLQKYQYGLDPFNPDNNNDGLPDSFEMEYLGTGPSLRCTNQVRVALTVNGSAASNYLGNWQVDGTDIYCLDRRGGLDFGLPVNHADKYVLNLIGTQNQPKSSVTRFKLQLAVDGQNLGHYTLNGGYGTNGTVELVLPYLQAGSHTLHVFWDGVASYSSLRIKQVKLLSVDGPSNQDGLKDWVAKMVSDESGLDDTNTAIGSYTSPVCLEGRDPCPTMMRITHGQTGTLSPRGTTDGRWYVNAPLAAAATQTVIQVSFQNGALTETRNLHWLPINLLTATNKMTIRLGDSLLLNAKPVGGTDGSLQIAAGTNTYSGDTSRPVRYRFTAPGNYTVTGTYTSPSGSSQAGSIVVDVIQPSLPRVQPAAWTGMERALDLPSLAPETTLEADSRLTCFIAGTNANGSVRLTLGADANEPRSVLERLGANGPVLDSIQVSGFDVGSGDQAYTKVLQVYPDGSQLVEMLVVSSPVETNVTFVLQPIVGGVVFDDGTAVKTLTATNFDALGQCPVRFIRPASATTSVCNSIKAYQGPYRIGYRH